MKVATDVLAVLADAECDGHHLRITEQLDRPMYVAVNKALVAAGGKWASGKIKAHVFPEDAADAIEQVVLTGEITTGQELGWFPTPNEIATQVILLAGLEAPGDTAEMSVLEPSAGEGAIAACVHRPQRVDCIELDAKRCATLRLLPYGSVTCADFLTITPTPIYGRVVMNPPFARQADIVHVSHALKFLRPGGLLVSVMSAGVTFRRDAKTAAFRALVNARGGSFELLPDDAFRPSGTLVRTVIATVRGAD